MIKVKKRYLSKKQMAIDIAAKFSKTIANVQSILSRDSTSPKKEFGEIEYKDEKFRVPFYVTPKKYLK